MLSYEFNLIEFDHFQLNVTKTEDNAILVRTRFHFI